MKNKIKYIGYCKDGNSEWISVRRKRGNMLFYRKPTKSSILRFQELQFQSDIEKIWFSVIDDTVDLQISIFF